MPTQPAYGSDTAFDSALDGGAGINDARAAASITAGEVNSLLKNLFRSFDVAVDKSDSESAGVAIQINAARDGLELVPATRRLPDVPTGQNARGILKSSDGAPPAYADVAAADLSSEIREELVNSFALTVSGGNIRIILIDGQGGDGARRNRRPANRRYGQRRHSPTERGYHRGQYGQRPRHYRPHPKRAS